MAAAVGAFLFIPQHLILGTNTVARMGAAIELRPGKTWCERTHGVPAGAGFIRMGVLRATPAREAASHGDYSGFGRVPSVRISLAGVTGPISSGSAAGFPSGRVDVSLDRPTRAARHARACVQNTGDKLISLEGEYKKAPNGVPGPRLSLTFLSADKVTWASRLDTVGTHFRYSHSGFIGTWALWLAALLMAGLAILSIWLIATRAREA